MILGIDELMRLIGENKLVEGLGDRDLNNPEGCVFDLRIEKIYSLKGNAFLGVDERETPDLVEEASYNESKKTSFIFEPGKYYMTKTIESVNLPENIAAVFKPRSTTFRCGLNVRTGFANPGYHGSLFFALVNEGPVPVTIELGARYVSVYFHEIKGKIKNAYRGQWQGGRTSTTGKEKQI